jgi:hypothetical protein
MTQFDPAIYGFIGTVAGGGIVVFGQWLNRRQDESRALTEFAVKTAIENWRLIAEKTERFKVAQHQYGLNPMDGYLIRTLALVQILQKRNFNPKNIEARLAELDSIGKVLQSHLEKKRPQQTPNPTIPSV